MTKEYEALRKQAEQQKKKKAELENKLAAITEELAKLECKAKDAITAGDDETYTEVYSAREKLLTKQSALQSMAENCSGRIAYDEMEKAWLSVKPSFDKQIEKASAEYVKARAACFAAYIKAVQARNEALKERLAFFKLTGSGNYERTSIFLNELPSVPTVYPEAMNRVFAAELSSLALDAHLLYKVASCGMPSEHKAL